MVNRAVAKYRIPELNDYNDPLLSLIIDSIKIHELDMELLMSNKPFRFQKKKMAEYERRLEEIENKLLECYEAYGEEISKYE